MNLPNTCPVLPQRTEESALLEQTLERLKKLENLDASMRQLSEYLAQGVAKEVNWKAIQEHTGTQCENSAVTVAEIKEIKQQLGALKSALDVFRTQMAQMVRYGGGPTAG